MLPGSHHQKPKKTSQTATQQAISLILNSFGVYVSFISLSYFQEKITRTTYDGERFNYILFLIFCQTIINSIYSGIRLFSQKKTNSREVPMSIFALSALSYIAAFYFSNIALKFINYPTQVLGKSCKTIPVLILGIIILKKKYPIHRYISVFLVSFGISVFMLEKISLSKKPQKNNTTDGSNLLGIIFLLLSLTFDGFQSVFQDLMRDKKKYKNSPSSTEIMFFSNLFAIIYVGIGLLISQEIGPAVAFCFDHPIIIFDISVFCICMAIGQTFIYNIIVVNGPLVCSIVTTTRKFFTILFSMFWFGHYISGKQWISILIVFGALLLDAFMSYTQEKKKQIKEKK